MPKSFEFLFSHGWRWLKLSLVFFLISNFLFLHYPSSRRHVGKADERTMYTLLPLTVIVRIYADYYTHTRNSFVVNCGASSLFQRWRLKDGADIPCSKQLRVNRAETRHTRVTAKLHFTQAAVAIAICLFVQRPTDHLRTFRSAYQRKMSTNLWQKRRLQLTGAVLCTASGRYKYSIYEQRKGLRQGRQGLRGSRKQGGANIASTLGVR